MLGVRIIPSREFGETELGDDGTTCGNECDPSGWR